MRLYFILLLSVATITTITVDVTGQSRRPRVSYQQRLKAKRLFNQGHLAYRRGNYEEAILKWERSYELSQEPLIFESIANAYERLGEHESALSNIKKWRQHAPRREHTGLDERISNLEERIARIEAAERKREELAEAQRQKEATKQAKEAATAQRKRDEERAAAAGIPFKIVGWSAVGLGSAAIVAGAITSAVGVNERADLGPACTKLGESLFCQQDFAAQIDRSNTMVLAGDISWIAGSAVAAGGLLLLVTGTNTFESSADSGDTNGDSSYIYPMLVPGFAGLTLGSRF